MGEIHKPHPIKVGFRIAEQLRQLAVDKKGTTVSGKEGDADGGVLKQPTQRITRHPIRQDRMGNGDDPDDVAPLIPDGSIPPLANHRPPILCAVGVHIGCACAFQDAFYHRHDPPLHALRHQKRPRGAQNFFRRPTEQTGGSPVPIADAPLPIQHDHCRWQLLQDGLVRRQ
jgi:hypothetical protein